MTWLTEKTLLIVIALVAVVVITDAVAALGDWASAQISASIDTTISQITSGTPNGTR